MLGVEKQACDLYNWKLVFHMIPPRVIFGHSVEHSDAPFLLTRTSCLWDRCLMTIPMSEQSPVRLSGKIFHRIRMPRVTPLALLSLVEIELWVYAAR